MCGQCFFDRCDCRFFTGTSGACSSCSHPNLFHLVKPNAEDVAWRDAVLSRQQTLFVKRAQRQAREAEEKRLADAAAHPPVVVQNTHPCSVDACDCIRFTAPAPPQPQLTETQPMEVAAPAAGDGQAAGSSTASPTSAAAVTAGSLTSRLQVEGGRSSVSAGSASGASGLLCSPMGVGTGTGSGWAVAADKMALLPRVCRRCKHAEMYHIKQTDADDKKGKGGKAPAKAAKAAKKK